jgi:hypothetical protein
METKSEKNNLRTIAEKKRLLRERKREGERAEVGMAARRIGLKVGPSITEAHCKQGQILQNFLYHILLSIVRI